MKILAIGNSFSVDAMQWVYEIARDCGVKDLVLGNLYIGGCSLKMHYENAISGAADYIYYKNTKGTWESKESSTMLDGIQDEAWDIITMQQVSGFSGMQNTYDPYLEKLLVYVQEKMRRPDTKFVWHMTWAYQNGAEHDDFVNYDEDQEKMYHAIIRAVQGRIVPDKSFSDIIPAGTAIQNVRNSFIGDTLTRDGYHLSLHLGRYIAGMTWVKKLLHVSIDDVTFVPDVKDISKETLAVVKKAVNHAIMHPFSEQKAF